MEKQYEEFVQVEMKADPAHDLNHVRRVVKMAKLLCERENAVSSVVIPAAWLHDCYSVAKNHPERHKSSKMAADKAIKFLSSIGYSQEYFGEIHHVIVAHSYSANVQPETIEARVVQDADRLDAIGAIGVARCIQVSTTLERALYCSTDTFCTSRVPDDDKYAIDHFYLKLLRLGKLMTTDSGIIEAKKRTDFMQSFLKQLKNEV